MSTFTERMIGAATLNVHTYEEVEADTTATPQAMGVVVLSSIAQGIAGLAQEGGIGFVGSVHLWLWRAGSSGSFSCTSSELNFFPSYGPTLI